MSQPTDTWKTTSPEHCIAAIGLDAYRRGRSCHSLIFSALPARRYWRPGVSIRCSSTYLAVGLYCTWQWMAVLHRMFTPHTARTMIGSGYKVHYIQLGKVESLHNLVWASPIEGNPSNFVFKLSDVSRHGALGHVPPRVCEWPNGRRTSWWPFRGSCPEPSLGVNVNRII